MLQIATALRLKDPVLANVLKLRWSLVSKKSLRVAPWLIDSAPTGQSWAWTGSAVGHVALRSLILFPAVDSER